MRHIYIVSFLSLILLKGHSQITTTVNPGLASLTNYFQGAGLTITNMSVTAAPGSYGLFSGSSTLTFTNGIIMSTGKIDSISKNASYFLNTNNGAPGNFFLETLSGGISYDACMIEFDCVPGQPNLLFSFAFGSEEYDEFVGSTYNDAFAILVSGINPAGGNYLNKNVAFIPSTTTPVISVNSINNGPTGTGPCMNCAYYINNSNGTGVAFDGFTSALQGLVPVVPGQTYHFKIAIADVDDPTFDSGVMFLANSFKSVSNPTGIAEQAKENRISVYPNPVSGSFLTIDSQEAISAVELYAYNGQQMELAPFDEATNTLHLNGMAKGIYVLHVTTKSGKDVRKIVIN